MKSLSIFAVLAVSMFLALGGPGAHAQQEIDPDHFDLPNTEPMPQPRTADRKVRVIRYHGTFSLPYNALCNGKKLAPGKYLISLRFDRKIGHATLDQKGDAIEIEGVVRTDEPKHRDEVIVFDNNKGERILSAVRVRGFDFVFDPKYSADPSPGSKPTRAQKLPLMVIARSEIANQVPPQRSPKP